MKNLHWMLVAAIVSTAASTQAVSQDSFGDEGQGQAPQGYPQQQGGNPQQQGGYPQPQGGNPQQQGGYPQQQGGYPPQQGGYPQQPGGYPPQPGGSPMQPGGTADLDQLMQMERQDFGVKPTSQLHAGQMHGPTPASIPGGQLITTKGLVALVQGKQAPYLLFDVLGGNETLPGAAPAVQASQAGSFNDQVQQQFGAMIQQMSGGNKETPLVFYCLSSHCWMSYNAALRAINLGYKNVLWYRGGIEAWKLANLPVQSSYSQQGGYGQQGGYDQQGGYGQ